MGRVGQMFICASERKDFPWCLIARRLHYRISLALTQLPVKCSTFTFVRIKAI